MRLVIKKIINSFSSLARSILRIVQASIKIISQLFLRGIRELLLEILLFGLGLGLIFLFSSWGASNSFALGLSIVIVILICIFSIRFFFFSQSKLVRKKVRGEEQLANWIAQNLAQKAPKEWDEYQDWLHDILFDRFQMLDRGYPIWKVKMITYGRLIGFCFVLSLIKLRRLAIRLRA